MNIDAFDILCGAMAALLLYVIFQCARLMIYMNHTTACLRKKKRPKTAKPIRKAVLMLTGPVTLPAFAVVYGLFCIPESFVSQAIPDFLYRVPRVTRHLWGMVYGLPGAGYYCYRKDGSRGNGPARYLKREPKLHNWIPAEHTWWVFCP